MSGGRYEVVVAGRLGPLTRNRFPEFTIEERRDVRVAAAADRDGPSVLDRLTRCAGVTGVRVVSVVRGEGGESGEDGDVGP